MSGTPKEAILSGLTFLPLETKLAELATGAFLEKPESAINGTGYCVASLEAALWCFFKTDSFQSAVLRAANLGDDADTTAAITGQIAGAYYGAAAIRPDWIEKLSMRADIEEMAKNLYERFHPEFEQQ